jgi:hypothetical protein
MAPGEKDLLKLTLRNYCLQQLQARLAVATQLVLRAQDSANNEGKSSAGDKYETARSMGQLEKQMYQNQEQQIRNELAAASATDIYIHSPRVTKGSLIFTAELIIFVCAGLGKQVVDNATIFFISADAPLFGILRGKSVGENFTLNKLSYTITELW